jgi:hypothetical protein
MERRGARWWLAPGTVEQGTHTLQAEAGQPEVVWHCAYCPDAGVRAKLDGVPWPSQPRDSGLAQQGHQSSREAHAARRWLHMASGAAADGASTRARAHMAGHAARDYPDGACRYAARLGHYGAAAAALLDEHAKCLGGTRLASGA